MASCGGYISEFYGIGIGIGVDIQQQLHGGGGGEYFAAAECIGDVLGGSDAQPIAGVFE